MPFRHDPTGQSAPWTPDVGHDDDDDDDDEDDDDDDDDDGDGDGDSDVDDDDDGDGDDHYKEGMRWQVHRLTRKCQGWVLIGNMTMPQSKSTM